MASAAGPSGGLLSDVLSFVSRELESFVTNATGGSSSQQPPEPGPSTLRVKSRSGNKGRRRAKPKVHDDTHSADKLKEKGAAEKEHANHRHIPQENHRRNHTLETYPEETLDAFGVPVVAEESDTDGASPSLPSTSLPPQSLRSRHSVTMPGSLFPRSLSLQPDTTPSSPSLSEECRVHLPSIHNPILRPARTHEASSSKSNNSGRQIYASGAPTIIYPDLRDVDDADDAEKVCAKQRTADLSTTGVDYLLVPLQSLPPVGKERIQNSHGKLPLQLSSKVKGKQRADKSLHEPYVGDTSGEIRVRGKERELVAARKEQKDREIRLELSPFKGVDRSRLEAERERDKEKIRLLELEVQRLKDELAKRRAVEPSLQTERSQTFYMPPPPPPPPPPPNPDHFIPAPTFRQPFDPGTSVMDLTSARASLKHTATPEEAPINPAYRVNKPRRTGQPTVNLGTDKLVAFLNEMKTVRLRKVGNQVSSGRVGQTGFTQQEQPSRKPTSAAAIGQKRKRTDTTVGVLDRSLPFLKRQLTTSKSSFALDKPTWTVAGPSSGPLSQSYPSTSRANLQTWGSISTDLTTPSLCSDNEHEGETATEEQSPPTPPAVDQSTQLNPIPMNLQPSQCGAIDEDLDAGHPTLQPPRRSMKTPPPKVRVDDLFSKRPATSPMPKIPTPKRPRKPAKSRVVSIKPPTLMTDGDDDDPLSLSYNSVDDILESNSPSSRHRKANSGRSSTIRKARRQTLDEEIRIAEDDGQMDSGVFVGVGSRSKKKGFLAGGGAAGAPVFMGVGYVEGAEESDKDGNVGGSDGQWRPQRAIRGRRRR